MNQGEQTIKVKDNGGILGPQQEHLPPKRQQSIEGRLEIMKKLVEKFKIPISQDLQNDSHFWYLVLREYWAQRKTIPQTLKLKIDRQENLANIRLLSIQNAVDFASQYAALEKKAALDPLTGAFNRGALDQYLIHLLSHRRNGTTDAVVMIDLDFLREINNQYGHSIGDLSLKAFAELIQKNIRGIDFFARYGGEEFFLIMPDIRTDEVDWQQKILKRIDDLRKKIEQNLTSRVNQTNQANIIVPITASFGVMFVDDQLVCANGQELAEKVYSVVDGFLYQAKNHGRNCVVGHSGVYQEKSETNNN